MSNPLRLLIADHAPTRLGIRMAIGDQFRLCAEAGDAERAIRAAKREQPDVCLVGYELPGDALAAVRGVARAAPEAAVILLGGPEDADVMLEAVRAGVIGYVPGMVSAQRLQKIVRAVAAREASVPRSMVLDLMLELRGAGAGADGLTARETQVLGMLRRGHATAEIADRLAIAPVTVRRHISELVRKLGVENRAGLTTAHAS